MRELIADLLVSLDGYGFGECAPAYFVPRSDLDSAPGSTGCLSQDARHPR
jgi:hypothetical protein